MSRHLSFAGKPVPLIGLGTWRMGESSSSRPREVAAVRTAIELGYRVIDTAEMYGNGGAEEVVGKAVADSIRAGDIRREDLVIVTKVMPQNASRSGVAKAFDRSRARLALDSVDVYLLHWPGSHPLRDTVDAFERLKEDGQIREWGVSNFDVDDLASLWKIPAGKECITNQVYYSASERGVEFELIPWQRDHGVSCMAYSPIDQGAIANDPTLAAIAKRHRASAAQIALAWVTRHPDVVAIPKAVQKEHLQANIDALGIELTPSDLADIDAKFPPPRRKRSLSMI